MHMRVYIYTHTLNSACARAPHSGKSCKEWFSALEGHADTVPIHMHYTAIGLRVAFHLYCPYYYTIHMKPSKFDLHRAPKLTLVQMYGKLPGKPYAPQTAASQTLKLCLSARLSSILSCIGV